MSEIRPGALPGNDEPGGREAARGRDHWEIELAGRPGAGPDERGGRHDGGMPTMAAVTDKGLSHHRNEDAVVARSGSGISVVVVCDGVSTTANPDQASTAAAVAFADFVESALPDRHPTLQVVAAVMASAVEAAQRAAVGAPPDEPGGYPRAPATTLVAAVITADGIVTTNVGDSRAYWIDASAPEACRELTRDDSLAEEAISAGMSPEEAHAGNDAHVITRWLGAGAPGVAPHTQVTPLPSPGILLVCSDGLWNYYESAGALRGLLAAGDTGESLLASARRLVDAALAAGGHDNITVALTAIGARALQSPPGEYRVEPGPLHHAAGSLGLLGG